MSYFKVLYGAVGGGSDTSDATAVSSDILLDKTAYARGMKLTGTMPIQSQQDETIASPKTFPPGYYATSFVITPDGGGIDISDTTAVRSDVLATKVFYNASGTKVAGLIQTQTQSSETINTAKTYNEGYYPNSFTITPYTGPDVSDTTATASDVLSTKSFYNSNGVKVNGTMQVGSITLTTI